MAVLAAGYLGLCAFALHHSTIWQETFVLGVNVGGMSEEEATQAVSDALSEMQISLYLYPDGGEMPDTAVQTPDAQIPLSDLDAQIDVPALVQGADAAQRAGSFFTAGMAVSGRPQHVLRRKSGRHSGGRRRGFHSGRGHCRLAFLAGAGHQLYRDGRIPWRSPWPRTAAPWTPPR